MKELVMVWYVVFVLTSLIFDVFRLVRMSPDEKDMEILLLQQQLMIVGATEAALVQRVLPHYFEPVISGKTKKSDISAYITLYT